VEQIQTVLWRIIGFSGADLTKPQKEEINRKRFHLHHQLPPAEDRRVVDKNVDLLQSTLFKNAIAGHLKI
jgi:hypothetical protein